MEKKTFLYALLPFIILVFLSIVISYDDNRALDGPITFGYPLKFYLDNSDGRFCSNPDNINSELCNYPKIDYQNLFINLILIYLISFVITYLVGLYKK